MANKKVAYTENIIANNDFLNSILHNTSAAEKKSTPAPATVETGSEKTANNEKVLVNFKMNRASLERLRTYCKNNDMTLTAGIKRAIRKMLAE